MDVSRGVVRILGARYDSHAVVMISILVLVVHLYHFHLSVGCLFVALLPGCCRMLFMVWLFVAFCV